jgi:DNA-binding Xre family transcriptional regulator
MEVRLPGLYCQYNPRSAQEVIEVRLRETMEAYRRRTGKRMTYHTLAKQTGLARSTIESVATRKGYNASLATIDRLCGALGCQPGELLVYRDPRETID